jgi:hypothetical protein
MSEWLWEEPTAVCSECGERVQYNGLRRHKAICWGKEGGSDMGRTCMGCGDPLGDGYSDYCQKCQGEKGDEMRGPCKTCGVVLRDSEPGLYCAPCQVIRQVIRQEELSRERTKRNTPSDTPGPPLQPCGHETRYIPWGETHCLLCRALAAEEELEELMGGMDRLEKWRESVMGLLELGNGLVELLKKEKEETN